jgi:hypothetical protein
VSDPAANPLAGGPLLPVEIVLHPSWWHRRHGIVFDEDFFFHPARRVEEERKMEQALYERWGRYGLGADRGRDLPVVGAVHQAAGYLVSAMLGCRVEYRADAAPQVLPAGRETPAVDPEAAFLSPPWRRLEALMEALRDRFGRVAGDVNWGGILNAAMDLRGEAALMDLLDRPDEARRGFAGIAAVIDGVTRRIEAQTGSSSISVNRNVRHFGRPVFLHSECSHTMISVADYEAFLRPFDIEWSRTRRPFGVHYCGVDPHRYAASFAALPHLDFLDVGWGGDVALLRRHLPRTFLNLRLSPVEILRQSPEEIRADIERLVRESGDPRLTGVCCINLDHQVRDGQVEAILETVEELRREAAAGRAADGQA